MIKIPFKSCLQFAVFNTGQSQTTREILENKCSLLMKLFSVLVFAGSVHAQAPNEDSDTLSNQHRIKLAKECVQRSPDSSIYYITPVMESPGSDEELIRARSILGDAYQYKQNYDKAVSNYLKAIELGEKSEQPGILANAYNGIGMTYFALNEIDKAEKFVLKAAEEKLEVNDYLYYSVIRSNLAVVYNRKEKYDKSNEILLSTKKVLIEHDKQKYLPNIYMTMGANFQTGKSNLDSARAYYQKAVDIGIRHNSLMEVKTGCLNLAEISFIKDNPQEALHYLYRAKPIKTSRKLDQLNVAIFNKFSEVFEALNRYDSAYAYKKKAMELKEKVFNIEKQKRIDELELKYETARKEQEIEKQRAALNQSKIEAERSKNQLYIIAFSGILLVLLFGGTAVYYWQRRRTSRLHDIEKTKIFENIVHDIQTPLTLIRGSVETVKNEGGGNEKLLNQVSTVEYNTQKLGKLVDELLDAARLKKGKFVPEYSDGNIASFLTDIVQSFKSEADQKNIRINGQFEKHRKNHHFPVNVVEKVVNNLITNSLKYCPEHSEITLYSMIENGQLILKIKDNGPGIPETDREKVFNRFYRVANREQQGSGIGLSIVKELVDRANGDIRLSTDNDKGTEFICTLPVMESISEKHTGEVKGELPRLLIVDNDSDILQFVADIFEGDFEIITAQNGARGVECAKEYVPDFILTDIKMPVKDGIELLKEVKNEEITQHIPVVVFSAKTSLENRLRGLKYGADAYIPKPFSREELRLTLANIHATIKRNRQDFQDRIKSNKTFEERLKSKNAFINKATDFVIENIENPDYTIHELANDLCISRSQLHRKISSTTGFSSTNFIKMVRLEKAKDMLESNSGNVTEVAYSCGFNSQSYFTKSFKEYFGKSPSLFLKNRE